MATDRIDLYQTHWPAIEPDKTPIAETMACLVDLQRAGKIRAIGVSNVSAAELREHIACGDIVANQPRYSMLCRDIEQDIVPICLAPGISILASHGSYRSYVSYMESALTIRLCL